MDELHIIATNDLIIFRRYDNSLSFIQHRDFINLFKKANMILLNYKAITINITYLKVT